MSDKATLARYRELKKRYMKVVKENARLRKQLSVYEAWTDDKEVESEVALLTQEQVLPVDTCTLCGEGTYSELDLGHLIIKTCDKCGYRSRHKVSPIRD